MTEDQGPVDDAAFHHEGTCRGCGCNSSALSVHDLCRSCTRDVDHQTLPYEPEDGLPGGHT